MIDDDAFSVPPSSPMPPLVPGEPVFSWCNMCLTTSHYRVETHIMNPRGLTLVAYRVGCLRCEPPWPPPGTPGTPETEESP